MQASTVDFRLKVGEQRDGVFIVVKVDPLAPVGMVEFNPRFRPWPRAFRGRVRVIEA